MEKKDLVVSQWYLSLVLVTLRKMRKIDDARICIRSRLDARTIAGLESFDVETFDRHDFYKLLGQLCDALEFRVHVVFKLAETLEEEALFTPPQNTLQLGRLGFTPELIARAEKLIVKELIKPKH